MNLIERAKELDRGATEGPWKYKDGHVDSGKIKIIRGEEPNDPTQVGVMDDDCGEFIAEARQLLPQLAQKLEEAIKLINEIREDCPDRLDYCKCDCKAKAQEFLKKMEDGK